MFSNYLKTAIRNLFRQPFYAAINVLGLATGIACFILIGLWVQDELSYDRHFNQADRIYRIANGLVTDQVNSPLAQADPRIADHIRKDYAGIGTVVRLHHQPSLLLADGRNVYETQVYYADTTFFSIFSGQLAEGSLTDAFRRKNAVVISTTIARKLFGRLSPIGRNIIIRNERAKDSELVRTVTDVLKDHPGNSHFQATVIAAKQRNMDQFEPTYIRFNHPDGAQQFEQKLWPQLYNKYFKEEYVGDGQGLTLNLQPLTSIHLQSKLLWELEANGSLYTVYIFSAIALFLLLTASVNYSNLATARFMDRSREVILRKVIGATKQQIAMQFLTEAVLMAFMGLVLALSMVEISLPSFNALAGKELYLHWMQPWTIITLIVVTLVAGLVSGIYPAFLATSVSPASLLNGRERTPGYRPTLRQALVVLQFTLSIVMLIATMVASMQLDYAEHKDLGFRKEQVLVLNLEDPVLREHTEALKTALLSSPDVLQVSASHNIPGDNLYNFYHNFETQRGGMQPRLITTMLVDYDYFRLMDIPIVKGTGFDSGMNRQLQTGLFVVLNESAVKELGWKNPVGKMVETGRSEQVRRGRCVGVVKDFHVASLHDPIVPMVFRLARRRFKYLSVRLRAGEVTRGIRSVSAIVRRFGSGYPLQYSFLDKTFNAQYAKDDKQQQLFKLFAGLCIFISCLGLMGLTAYATRQRNREIGIRKIAGASVADIVLRLSKDFMKPVLAGVLIAIPAAHFIMNAWLQSFAYHIEISWLVYLIAGIAGMLIALATISIYTISAAYKNPVTVLKKE